jgi:uncharacterized membrane protein YeaQ/YmgE (transglycosylase-associated protein family)
MNLDPGGLLAWLIVGLVAGFLASALGLTGSMGLLGSIVVAFIGAVAFIAIVHPLPGRSPV